MTKQTKNNYKAKLLKTKPFIIITCIIIGIAFLSNLLIRLWPCKSPGLFGCDFGIGVYQFFSSIFAAIALYLNWATYGIILSIKKKRKQHQNWFIPLIIALLPLIFILLWISSTIIINSR